MTPTDLTFEKGLPANLDAERFVLGSVLLVLMSNVFSAQAQFSTGLFGLLLLLQTSLMNLLLVLQIQTQHLLQSH